MRRKFAWAKNHLLVSGAVVAIAAAVASLAIAETIPSMSRPAGAACNDYVEGEACASGIAIDITFGFVCTDYCTDDADCPEEWGCKGVPQGNGENAYLCFPRRVTVSE